MTFVDVLVMVAFGPPHRLASLLAGGGLLSLPLDRRLVVGHAPLHLLEQAVLLHLLFQRLEGRLDLIVDDDDLGGDDHQADNRSRRGIHRFQPRTTVGGATSMAWRRPAPDTNAAAIVAKISRDCSTDRKSTRLNSSHVSISYAVFCLKKKKPDRYAGCMRREERYRHRR